MFRETFEDRSKTCLERVKEQEKNTSSKSPNMKTTENRQSKRARKKYKWIKKRFLCKYQILHLFQRKLSLFASRARSPRSWFRAAAVSPLCCCDASRVSWSFWLASFRSAPILYTWMLLVEQEGTSDSIRAWDVIWSLPPSSVLLTVRTKRAYGGISSEIFFFFSSI